MVAPEVETFGDLLRQFRLAAALSQEALAERARLSVAAIAALERGRRTAPRADTVALLADGLELSAANRARFIGAGMAVKQPVTTSATPANDPILLSPTSTLPAPPTPLIGREKEEVLLGEALRNAVLGSGTRIVTLTGPGGVGKTRLALAVSAAQQGLFADGVFWVDLSDVRDPALAASAVGQALGVKPEGPQVVRDALIARLKSNQALLILDNFEQVVDAASLVSDLIAQCARLVVLITSRIALRVRGEQQFQVPPLSLPSPERGLPLEVLAGFAATRLFVARARAARPDFTLRADHAEAVAEICRRVDGLPLAIELAAARIALLSPPDLLARLESRLALLRGGARDLPERQQTMRAAIDWSYDLLSPGEQVLFRRLAVFQGGCTLEAAEATCAVRQGGDVLEGIGSLLEKSLLGRREQHGGARLHMLETLQEYAREQLNAYQEMESARQAHAVYYLARAEADWTPNFDDSQIWLTRWAGEHDNVRAALRWTREKEEAELGLRLACAIWRLWIVQGYLQEGRVLMDDLLRLPGPVSPAIRAKALRCASALAVQMGDLAQGAVWCTECLALCRELDDRPHMADVLNTLGNIARNQQDFILAVAYYDQSMSLYRELGDRVGKAVALNNRGTVARYQGDLTLATHLYRESLAIRRETGDTWGIAYILHNLSVTAWRLGEIDEAMALGEESLALRRDLGDRQGMVDCLTLLGLAARSAGRFTPAADCFREAVDLSHQIGKSIATIVSLVGLAGLAADHKDAPRAARLLGMASALRDPDQLGLPPEDDYYDLEAARVLATLGESVFSTAWTTGKSLPLDVVVREILDPYTI